MARIAEQPTYTFQVIERKKNEDKKTYEGLTFNLMMDYLDTLSDYLGISDPEKSAAVEAFRNSLEDMRVDKVPFGHRKKAFLEKFPHFNVAKAKAFIREQHFEALKEDYEIVSWGEPEIGSNVIPYNPASGQ